MEKIRSIRHEWLRHGEWVYLIMGWGVECYRLRPNGDLEGITGWSY
jgi:hypothetical protein